MTPAAGRRPLSFTAAAVFRDCPLAYRLRYVDRIPVGRAGHLEAGEVCHRAIARYMCHLRDAGRSSDLAALERIRDETAADASPEAAADLGDVLDAFGRTFALDAPPGGRVLVEERLALDADLAVCAWGSPDAAWRGVVDLAVVDRAGRARITDWKTGFSLKHDPAQPLTYFLLLNRAHGVTAATVEFLFVRQGRLVGPIDLGEADLAAAERWIRSAIRRVGDEETFAPTPGASCSQCGYAGTAHCPADLSAVHAVKTAGEAATVAAEIERLDGALKTRRSALAVWCAANGPVRIGDVEYAHVPGVKEEIEAHALFRYAEKDARLDEFFPLVTLRRSAAARAFLEYYRDRLEAEGRIKSRTTSAFRRRRTDSDEAPATRRPTGRAPARGDAVHRTVPAADDAIQADEADE